MRLLHFIIAFIAVLQLNGQETKIIHKQKTLSELDKRLKNHAFKTTTGAVDPQHCLADCWDENEKCQSFNFFPDTKICELNTKSSSNAPNDYINRKGSVYCTNPGFGLKVKLRDCRITSEHDIF